MTPIPSSKLVRDVAPPKSKEPTRSTAVSRVYESALPRATSHRLPVRPDTTNGPVFTRHTTLSAFDEESQVPVRASAFGSAPIALGESSTPFIRDHKREISAHGISPALRSGRPTLTMNDTFPGRPRKEHEGASSPMRTSRLHTSNPLNQDVNETPNQTYLPSPTWDQMQNELELLRRAVQDMHKITAKQNKKIEELSNQLTGNEKLLKDRATEITALKAKCTRSEQMVNTVEASIQCQICMDLPLRPYALSPCGHVLCMTCLQEWFKTSPDGPNEDDEETDRNAALFREKTCPCCRTGVRHRPSPVFMVKAIATALAKSKQIEPAPPEDVESQEDDPWNGIFPSSDSESSEGEGVHPSSDDAMDEDDTDSWMLSLTRRRLSISRASWSDDSDPDEELDDYLSGRYADYDDSDSEGLSEPATLPPPPYEPPSVSINPNRFDLEDLTQEERATTVSLLRRGCSWEMIQEHKLDYTDENGIVVSLNSLDDLYPSDNEGGNDGPTVYRVHLGWNISLDSEDEDGDSYLTTILLDIRNRRDSWHFVSKPDGSQEVRRRAETELYSSDSDHWLDSEDEDDTDSD
ncbi:hypothetical protein BKA70DRAFT_1274456 [Coprinopsis sp. MPI-PUGE-AT-0042]|nr:hypothetical protein BKA70DRAFT_1274456 [Coprinopsis sp. MPI-PUGE-AT-0042]